MQADREEESSVHFDTQAIAFVLEAELKGSVHPNDRKNM